MNRIDYLQAVIESQRSPIEVFMGMQEDKESAIIIDVRIGDKAFLKEKIAGALEIPLLALEANLATLDKTKLIYVTTWGASCTLAKQASIILINNGFQVLEIAGGNESWAATNLPMEEILVSEVKA